jgi:transcriptional regulator with XRE-family HTH domain
MSRRELADRIRELRELRSWTQAHLATAAEVSLRTVQRLETTGNCSRESLQDVASAFEIDGRELTALRFQNKGGCNELPPGN